MFLRGTLRPLVLPLRALRPEPLGGQALEQPAFFCPLAGSPDACGPAPARPRASSGTVAIPASRLWDGKIEREQWFFKKKCFFIAVEHFLQIKRD